MVEGEAGTVTPAVIYAAKSTEDKRKGESPTSWLTAS